MSPPRWRAWATPPASCACRCAASASRSRSPSFAIKWLVPLERFKALHPDIEVWVSADMGLVDLAVADVDLAIRYGAGGYADSQAQMLLTESVVPICSPALIEGDGALRNPADIARFALLHDDSPDRDPSCPTWPMWLMARGLDVEHARKGLRFNQSSLVVEAAIAGKGIALAKASSPPPTSPPAASSPPSRTPRR
ncbi:MAG: LysR substrate-binding domain-containing protein [Alphaproteobacteria bacterium]